MLRGNALAAGNESNALWRSVLVKGAFHSGTNFLFALLRFNFGPAIRGTLSQHGIHEGCDDERQPTARVGQRLIVDGKHLCCSKHGTPSLKCIYEPPVAAIVVIVRSPYSWLVAMHKRCYCQLAEGQANLSFSAFLRAPLVLGTYAERSVQLHTCGAAGCENPIAHWVASARSILQVLPNGERLFLALRYEDLFSRRRLTTNLFRPLLARGVPAVGGGAHFKLRMPLHGNERAGPDDARSRTVKNYKHDYIFTQEVYARLARAVERRSYLRRYTQADLEWVNKHAEPTLLRGLGYEVIRDLPTFRTGSSD